MQKNKILPGYSKSLTTSLDHRGGLARSTNKLRPDRSLFDCIGGREVVARIVDGLYDRIAADRELRRIFTGDLHREREVQKAFFEEWLGGDPLFSRNYAYSGLALRHRGVHITRESALRWLNHLTGSLEETEISKTLVKEFLDVIRPIALRFVNEEAPADTSKSLRCARGRRSSLPRALAEKGDLSGLSKLLKADSSLLNRKTGNDVGMLWHAASRGHVQLVVHLHKMGADINAPHPLHHVAHIAVAPYCIARMRKHHDMADYLLSQGAVIDIFTAAFLGDIEAAEYILDRNPSLVNEDDPAQDFASIRPIHHAVHAGNTDMARFLFSRGAQVGPNSATPIAHAANEHQLDLVKLLLKNGADASAVGPGKWVKHKEIAHMLANAGANVNQPPGGWIWISCTGNNSQRDDPEYVEALLNHGADLHAQLRGAGALHYAAKAGFAGALTVLLRHGARVNAQDSKGDTPLMYASRAGRRADVASIIRILKEHGAVAQH